MFRTCYTTVSDLAVCQRCPALFGYKLHRHEKDAWRVGIHGSGNAYGSMFHKNIARVFFEAAADVRSMLHAQAVEAVSGGLAELEEFIRENIFMPFVAAHSDEYTPGQLMAAARGVKVWVRAMAEFFAEIPSLRKNPARTMSTVFLAPEQKLQGHYDFPNEGRLVVTGCYDALLFNPDKAEARLFEFKGYAKSDLAVPLSQSLLYAWLIWSFSGIVPSVEVIYLDEEDRKPDVFDPASVKEMMRAGLPGLFYAAFNTITLRRLPEIMRDKDLCGVCRFREGCASDWSGKFRRRLGASMVNVLVFFIAATMITTQVFFFSTLSAENTSVQMETLQHRFQFDYLLDEALKLEDSYWPHNQSGIKIIYDKDHPTIPNDLTYDDDFSALKHGDIITPANQDMHVDFYDLNYIFVNGSYMPNSTTWENQSGRNIYKRIFPPMGAGWYLIRIYDEPVNGKRALMYQVLVQRIGNTPVVKSFQEVWF